ncbi:MAG: flagellar motor protein MotB [Flavobacteriales bacterium]|nr:MAG: flagellar motor protein MotB [Flavobacteriales bacterium]
MKKNIIALFALASASVFGQSYTGYLTDNYSGVHTVINNPANIVDSHFRTDINLIGASVGFGNDYFGADKLLSELISNPDGIQSFLKQNTERYPSTRNNAVMNMDILGPSFMFNLNKKNALALSSRLRGVVNANNINGRLYEIYSGFDKSKNATLGIKDMNVNQHFWGELGLSYATVLMDNNEHFLKGGVTVKYLQGIAYSKANADASFQYDANGTPNNDNDNTLDIDGTVNYGYTSNINDIRENFSVGKLLESMNAGSGFGGDIGLTYEWRPDYTETDRNKYKLKFGLSVTDIGKINYKDATQDTYTGQTTIANQAFQDEKLEDLLNGLDKTSKKSLEAKLPTALHLNADWNINQKFYLNFNANMDIAGDKINANNIENSYILTPRFESKLFSAYIPMGLYEYSGFQAGFGLRAGPLYVGSGSVITNLIGETKGADFYFGLKIPLYKKVKGKKDTDRDGIVDAMDACPEVPGVVENNGCPEEEVVSVVQVEEEIGMHTKSIYFNYAKSTFKEGVTQKLDAIVAVMNEYPENQFSIEGHTDNKGTPNSNQILSEKRAKAVMNYLIKKGISASRLSARGFGQTKPIDTNDTKAGRANNRRVEIKVKK